MRSFHGSRPPTGSWEHLRVEGPDDGVLTVTLDRPATLNALTFAAYADLRDLFQELAASSPVRCVVLRGAGGTFSSGGDVHEIIGPLLGMDTDELLSFTRMTGEVIRAMRECPVPVVAAVEGMAAGAGSVLALASDFRVMGTGARFAFLFTKVGLAGADMGSAYLLPRVVGLGRATEMLMLGDTIDAAQAERVGLATRVVPDDDVIATAVALAARLAGGPAFAYRQTKQSLTRELDMSLSAAVEFEAVTQALLMRTVDFAEFHAAFTVGRQPQWQGR